MFLQRLHLQNFRCFIDKTVQFQEPLTIIKGLNGQGKTSIIEAIYYLSYFKSFRSHMLHDLMHQGSDLFFLKGDFFDQQQGIDHSLQIGHAQQKKSIKFDQKTITSCKQVLHLFQSVSLTEQDIDLIKGAPSLRRAFIDHAVVLYAPETIDIYGQFKKILHQRNSFLWSAHTCFDRLEYDIWTEQLFQISEKIYQLRLEMMCKLVRRINELLSVYFDNIYQVALQYQAKAAYAGQFNTQQLLQQEIGHRRSLFGAHLDDISFQIQHKKARVFASRGQQKLIILLAKWALATLSEGQKNPIFLMDDFISDFDTLRLRNLTQLFLSSNNQVILTVPYLDNTMQSLFERVSLNIITLE